jgi:cleavage and polyadenylation specificity factor subunit 5
MEVTDYTYLQDRLAPTVSLHPINSYSFGIKAPTGEKDSSVIARLNRMRDKYAEEGIRRTVEAVMLVMEHNHPHILLIQVGSLYFKLPGGKIRPNESVEVGLQRKLNSILGPEGPQKAQWEISDLLCTWWRPNFETHYYPYQVPHMVSQKEMKKIFLVQLPPQCSFAVPKNLKLIAVPLFELYDNVSRFGNIIANIPLSLSRFAFHNPDDQK